MRCLLLTVVLIVAGGGLMAQSWEEPAAVKGDPFFPKPSYFRKHFVTHHARVELEAPARLSDYVVSGRLELSLRSYLDLVLANNTDVSITKYAVEINKNAITRAFSIFDPFATASFSTTRSVTPSGTALNGVGGGAVGNTVQIAEFNELNQPFALSYQQVLPTGTTASVGFSNTRISSNSAFSFFNPQHSADLNIGFAQPLLRNRGGFITRLPISIARSKLKQSVYTEQDQITTLVALAENAYWDVVNARENLRVQEESLKLADAALKRAQKELELGAISPLEIYQPQANFANSQISVVQARYALAQSEDALRKQMGADLDAQVRELPVVLTESVTPTVLDDTLIDREKAVEAAFRTRPDLKANEQALDVDELNLRSANNALLPDLSLTAQYGSSGIGGIYHPGTGLTSGNTLLPVIPGGFGDALGGVFGFGYPVYGFGLTLRLPIKDHRAAADLADAMVNKRLDTLRLRTAHQQVRLQVLNAISQLENSRKSIELAKTARDLAQKRVEADQKRYELGTTTLFFVLASQNDFVQAESNLVAQLVNYRRNTITLYQRTGRLLEERGIIVP